MSFLDLLDFLDSSPDVAIVPTRLRNILQSTHKAFPFSTVEEYLNAGDEASELLMRIPNFGRKTEMDLRRVVQEFMNAMAIGVEVSGEGKAPSTGLMNRLTALRNSQSNVTGIDQSIPITI